MDQSLQYKLASSPNEYEQVYRMNYATFVEEIPQHAPNERRRLVDSMLERSDCLVCLQGDRLVGMLAVCGERPFSLDHKLDDLESFLPAGHRLCEVRLLAVDPDRRRGRVFVGLLRRLVAHCEANGYDLAVFSATETQWPMYLRAGCVPFGPLLGTEEARFQGMYITKAQFGDTLRRVLDADRGSGRG